VKFGGELKKFLHSPSETPLKGVKIGILVEGFPSELTDSNVAAASRSAISKLAELGAEVKDISIPFYKDSGLIWMVGMAMVRIFRVLPPPLPRMFQELQDTPGIKVPIPKHSLFSLLPRHSRV
jgi:Asp-tRNA(Asn)/Glu-tRNA(Gln) amidotransferase A subunit family amidase